MGPPTRTCWSRTAQARGARVLRRGTAAGPAAARNLGLRAVRSPFVAFLDSDVVPDPQALGRLRRHLRHPGLAIAGARVLALRDARSQASCGSADSRDGRRTAGWVARYEEARSALDLGPDLVGWRPAVGCPTCRAPRRRLGSRRSVTGSMSRCRWPRTSTWSGGWSIAAGARYCPEAIVRHDHRVRVVAWLARRRDYGTGAALLARRHGTRVAPARSHLDRRPARPGAGGRRTPWGPVGGGIDGHRMGRVRRGAPSEPPGWPPG